MSEKKEFRLSMRISDDEKAALIRAAAMRNMNISDYITSHFIILEKL